jgi:hypothetical protein
MRSEEGNGIDPDRLLEQVAEGFAAIARLAAKGIGT